MRLIFLSAGTLLSAFFIIYGTLLAWRPDLFLKFHDTFVDLSGWSKQAPWRGDVYKVEYTILGVVYVAAGVFLGFLILTRLIAH